MSARQLPSKLGMLERSFALDRASMDKDKRTVRVKFATENPVQRWFGTEILDCKPGSVRMDRVKNGAAVLLEHSTAKRVGITESGDINNGECYAEVRFAKTAAGNEAMAEVDDGTLRWISVGYRVHRFDEKNPETENPEYRATDWEPMEISLVAIPADPGSRVMRSGANEEWEVECNTEQRNEMKICYDKGGESSGGGAGAADNSAAILTARNSEKGRISEILGAAQRFRIKVPKAMEEAQRAIDGDVSPEKFNRWIMDQLESAPAPSAEPAAEQRNDRNSMTIGERVASNPEYLAIRGKGKKTRVDLAMELDGMTRATLTTTVAGLTKYERPPGIVLVEQQPLLVADLLAPGMTEQTTVRYMREDTWTNAATALAEEGTFAEMSWDLSEQDAAIRKVGVIARATDEILADSAALASYINARVPFAVSQLQDQHLVTGSGSSNQITGLLNTSNIQSESAAASATPIDAILKAITKVRAVGFYEPDAILMHPTDWQSVCLTKDSNGQYLLGGPTFGPYGQNAYSNVYQLWGNRVVTTTAISQGTALVGAFRIGAQLWTRQGVLVEMTNSDASDFANGRIAIRAYLRHGLAVYRPTAFCQVTGIPA